VIDKLKECGILVHMKSKATNMGTCQCCGRVHKLPDGLIAKHGYTIQGSCFQGECEGTGQLPFELNKDLVDGYVNRVDLSILGYRRKIEEAMAQTDNKVVYDLGMQGVQHWVECEVVPIPDTSPCKYTLRRLDGEPVPWLFEQLRFAGSSPEKVAKSVRVGWLGYLDNQILRANMYINWQRKRLETWKVMPLLPL
jgi:hypothetical protein